MVVLNLLVVYGAPSDGTVARAAENAARATAATRLRSVPGSVSALNKYALPLLVLIYFFVREF